MPDYIEIMYIIIQNIWKELKDLRRMILENTSLLNLLLLKII